MNNTILCERTDCFSNEDGVCHTLWRELDKSKCPFFKTRKQLEDEEEKLYGFYEERDWEKGR